MNAVVQATAEDHEMGRVDHAAATGASMAAFPTEGGVTSYLMATGDEELAHRLVAGPAGGGLLNHQV